ncbi:acyl-CoA N-acyltransferase [Mariannaea sp. PMI_226]|nr:acyl-CoA N-acyltransferase [Mariannaea sp. PMI_226]
MSPQVIHLPDGQKFTVTPVFAGLGFKSHELNTHHNAFPIGWTVVLNTESQEPDDDNENQVDNTHSAEHGDGVTLRGDGAAATPLKRQVTSFSKPTLQGDNLFISSIANPSSTEFKPAASPTRQIAMMLWITLYWYFHQPKPDPQLSPDAAKATPLAAKPRGEWRINIKRDGILRSRNLIPKLERMGLITSTDTSVGTSLDDNGDEWMHMFVTQRMFWQLPGRLYLFSLQPTKAVSSLLDSPITSRPGSPIDTSGALRPMLHSPNSSFGRLESGRLESDLPGGPTPTSIATIPSYPIGPFFSSSHLPTYYPPAPLQYVFTNNIRHPRRPKPPRMGEVFYSRYVPSEGRYLSFRVASISPKPVPYYGPVGEKPAEHTHLTAKTDTALLETWMAKPRVSAFWPDYSPDFLADSLNQPHSFPVIGMWDGVPFGYFEIYWVKEDTLGKILGGETGDWDRGLHVLIGEEWARGRVPIWLSGLTHWCLNADYRTMSVCLEPRIDNARFLQRLEFCGFARERQVSFPHKQSWLVRMRRDQWDGPAL